MKITLDEFILTRLGQLLHIIDLLPFSGDLKTILKYIVATDFHNSIQFDDKENAISYQAYIDRDIWQHAISVKTTIGIQNLAQLDRYVNEFVVNITLFSKEAVWDFINQKDQVLIEPLKENKHPDFRHLSQFEFLKTYQLNFVSDKFIENISLSKLDSRLHFYLYNSGQTIRSSFPISSSVKILKQQSLLIYLSEEAEILLCKEAVVYLQNKEKLNLTHEDATEFFESFNKGLLITEFINKIDQKLKSIGYNEKVSYLSRSYRQSEEYQPKSRKKSFLIWFGVCIISLISPQNRRKTHVVILI